MNNRLTRADVFEFSGLWKDAKASNDKHVVLEEESLAHRTAVSAGSESQGRLKCALR